MRKGIDGLATLVQDSFELDPYSDSIFLFSGTSKDRYKCLYFDGDGFALLYKRLDNARIHHAKLIQPFLEKHQAHLKILFLPPYSPNLNLIEGLWKWMRATVIHNVFFSNVGKIRSAVQGFIRMINQELENTVKRLCLKI